MTRAIAFATPAASTGTGDAPDQTDSIEGIIGHSPRLLDVLRRVHRVAPTEMPVLITGETGTGKELLARAIHRRSRRAVRPMIAVNLAAVPETLAAAELFGHERGAFTGADRARIGRFEAADRGTLFLDEIGELSPELQVLLLRVLQEGDVERLGSGLTRRVDVRLVAATNRDLTAAVQHGTFREDLFYRLNVFPVHLPPLRDRPEDIVALAEYFLERATPALGRRFTRIDRASMGRLQRYAWPGNIRQLQSVIEQSMVLCDDEELQVPEAALCGPGGAVPRTDSAAGFMAGHPTLEALKERYIGHVLAATHGNMVRAAAILDVDRRSLYRMVARSRLGRPSMYRRNEYDRHADPGWSDEANEG